MKNKSFVLLILLLSQAMSFAQSNKGRLDGAFCAGLSQPIGAHAYSGGLRQLTPIEFGTQGIGLRLDCHAGLGGGWKIGLAFQNIRAGLEEEALNHYLLAHVDTAGFFVTSSFNEDGYYETSVFSLQIANDIQVDRLIVTPHFSLGLTQVYMEHRSEYVLKERGSNYSRTVEVLPSYYSSVNPVFDFGMRIAYSFDVGYGYFCPFLLAENTMYRTTLGLNFRTTDIHDVSTETTKWFSGDLRYFSLMLGASFYLK